jgi:hypothetical protein
MRPLKQPSLDELFRLYPQLRTTVETVPAQGSQMPPDFLRDSAAQSEKLAVTSHHQGEQT